MADFLLNELLPLLGDFSKVVYDLLTMTLADLISKVGITVPSYEWLDYSVLAFMLGGGLFLFLAITLIKWILDIVN